MILWIDARPSAARAPWMSGRFGIDALSAEYLGYRDASARAIFGVAREVGAVVMARDSDRRTHEEARRAVSDSIEVREDRPRRHASPGYRSPAEFERQLALTPRAACTRCPSNRGKPQPPHGSIV